MIYMSRFQIVAILTICLLGVLYALPNVLPAAATAKLQETLPSWLPSKTVSLGLDLQGGAHLLLGVKLEEAERGRLDGIRQEVRSRFARSEPRIGYTELRVQGGQVAVTLRDVADSERARAVVREISPDLVAQGEGTALRIGLSEAAAQRRADEVVMQSVEVVRRRIDEMGTREPLIQRQGADRVLVQVPGISDTAELLRIISPEARLSFQLVATGSSAQAWEAGTRPPGTQLLPGREGEQPQVVEDEILIGGEMLQDAQASVQQGQPVVNFQLDPIGARRFCETTTQNVGRPFAIVLDDAIVSAPVIRSAICGGNGVISGNFTFQSATDLALLLRAGALPAPLEKLEERTVGAGLGQDAIDAGLAATLLGLALVLVFMAVSYGFFGLLADIAMLLNLALLVALMTALQATLTLPGIAGIVLTMGMAVDANVLINERIREEVRAGRSAIAALDAGFRGALSAIIDSNVTHLIASFLMFSLGSGPVKGFAVALALGVLTSMFTSVLVTRVLVILWLRGSRPKTLPV